MTLRIEIDLENNFEFKEVLKTSVLDALDVREEWFGNIFRKILNDNAVPKILDAGSEIEDVHEQKNPAEAITAVSLPITDYTVLYNLIIGQATKSALKLAIEYLKMPKEALTFFQLILKIPDRDWKNDLTITDSELAKKVGKSTKTVQRSRNKLKEYMTSDGGKAVLDIVPGRRADRSRECHVYSLNLVFAIENGLKKFIETEQDYLSPISDFIRIAEIVRISELPKYDPVQKIFPYIKNELDNLSDRPIIIDTEAVLMKRYYANLI